MITNLSETCADENPVQLIVDYVVEENAKGDTDMLEERIGEIKERTGLNELNTDGGYFDGNVEAASRDNDVKLNYTNMTGSEPNPDIIPLSSFTFNSNYTKVKACLQGHAP